MIGHTRYFLIFLVACPAIAADDVAILSACDQGSIIATVSASVPIHVNSAIAGCYSITAQVSDRNVNGYTVDVKLPAIVAFESERVAAYRRSLIERPIERSTPAATADATSPAPSRFPDFQTQDLRGKPLRLSSMRGKVIAVTFWSPSAPRTLSDLTALRGLYTEFHPAGLDAIGVAMTSNEDRARAALDDTELDWPQISDPMGLAKSLSIPKNQGTTLILDENHNIVASGLRGTELTALVQKLLHTGTSK